MQKVKIYKLVNRATNNPFYVGATTMTLNKRLIGHRSGSSDPALGWVNKRRDFIKLIEKSGGCVVSELLIECNPGEVDYFERLYYDKFISDGHQLLQAPYQFNYIKQHSLKNKNYAHSKK